MLELLHDRMSEGQLGVRKTLGKIREHFYWINCKRDMVDWGRKYDLCYSEQTSEEKKDCYEAIC